MDTFSNSLASTLDPKSRKALSHSSGMEALLLALRQQEDGLRQGGGAKAIESQHSKKRLTVRERLSLLLDPGEDFLEFGLFAAFGMYEEWGGAPGAGVVTGLGRVAGRLVMVIANDATVKAGAFFPMTAKKVIRAQTMALENRIPTLYLVDSSGVFLPLQEDVFPDQDDFWSNLSEQRGDECARHPANDRDHGDVCGGRSLSSGHDRPCAHDRRERAFSGRARPWCRRPLDRKYSAEELGGATMHAEISGTVDFKEANDHMCLARLRSLVGVWVVVRRLRSTDRHTKRNATHRSLPLRSCMRCSIPIQPKALGIATTCMR